MKKNGILFDLDGTLWEVKNSTFESANKINIYENNLYSI